MAEMTVQEAIDEIDNWVFTVGKGFRAGQRLMSVISLIEQQAAEIAKKDRMIDKIYKPLQNCDCNGEKIKCDVLDKGLYPWDLCEYYWLCEIAWLEKEAQGVE